MRFIPKKICHSLIILKFSPERKIVWLQKFDYLWSIPKWEYRRSQLNMNRWSSQYSTLDVPSFSSLAHCLWQHQPTGQCRQDQRRRCWSSGKLLSQPVWIRSSQVSWGAHWIYQWYCRLFLKFRLGLFFDLYY